MTNADVAEFLLARITFKPWFEDETPIDRANWSITVEFLDRRLPDNQWLERQYRATLRDAASQTIAQAVSDKPEGGRVYDAIESVCHQLGAWWAAPDHGAYSVDWLCGYFAGRRDL